MSITDLAINGVNCQICCVLRRGMPRLYSCICYFRLSFALLSSPDLYPPSGTFSKGERYTKIDLWDLLTSFINGV